ncbi:MAG: rhodanese-related sulfurtransferase [Pseudohongiellaceae bacterium]|jgi:rhodanese-related sulfurtransferase
MGSVLLEALIVSAIGVALALAANGLRSDGLQLDRDYFPKGREPVVEQVDAELDLPAESLGSAEVETPDPADDEQLADAQPVAAISEVSSTALLHGAEAAVDLVDQEVAARLAEKGLTAVSHEAALALWRDPMYQEYEATVFLDARRAEQYEAGHIPGAWHFDPFYPERYIDTLLPQLASALTIVVYCKGGECDDSESAALYLMNLGAADASRLSIYVGGMEAWTAAELPLEQGERGSGTEP